jgi:hypothetical protein
MSPAIVAAAVLACLLIAVFLGKRIGRRIPEQHLSADSRDAVKLATGLVATMAALLLGLLVSTAKGGHDTRRSQVIQMAAKIIFLDRVLAGYGPEAADARVKLRVAVDDMVEQIWSVQGRPRGEVNLGHQAGDEAYLAIESLSPRDEWQRGLKEKAAARAIELGEQRALLLAQSVPSISMPMLIIVVCWLIAIFLSFSLLAPPNATANAALLISALSVSGAVFLILELDQPFGGAIEVSKEPIVLALNHLGK